MKALSPALAILLTSASVAYADTSNCEDWVSNPMMWWTTATTEQIVECLEFGADPNARNQSGDTPLHVAAPLNPIEGVFHIMINAGADPNTRNQSGDTPLHNAAATNRNPYIIQVMINAGANINARNQRGYTPLHVAARFNQNPEIIHIMLDAGADGKATDQYGNTPFDYAKENTALLNTSTYWALNDAQYQ